MTSLHLAAAYGSLELAQALLAELAADPAAVVRAVNQTERRLRTPLYAASTSGNTDLMRFLMSKGADPDIPIDEDATTLLHLAVGAKSNAVPLTLALLDGGADIDAVDEDGRTALHRVLLDPNPQLLSLLLDRGVNVNKPAEHGFTPLMITEESEISVMRALLDAKADPNLQNEFGLTVLHLYAAFRKQNEQEAIRLLIQRGADPNTRNLRGLTPLAVAVEMGRHISVPILLQEGADINWRGEDGNTLLHLAVKAGDGEILALLIQYLRKQSIEDEKSQLSTDSDSIAKFLDARNERQETPLHFAAMGDNLEILEMLLDAGATVDAYDNVHATPLCEAVAHEHGEVVELLQTRGADPKIPQQFKFFSYFDPNGHKAVGMAFVGPDPDEETLNSIQSAIDQFLSQGKSSGDVD